MSARRLIKRNIKVLGSRSATLRGYRMILNKKSYKNPNIGYSNIVEDKDSVVEGVLYDIDYNDMKKLDTHEGYPKHYRREFLKFESIDEPVLVYIANPEWTSEKELKTTKEYKNFLLEGKEFFSKEYFDYICDSIKVID